MTGLVRKATLLSACGLLLAGAAMAGIPNAANSTVGSVQVADYNKAVPPNQQDGINNHGSFLSATCIRDALNNPVPFATVVVDFSTCGTNVQMAEFQTDGGALVNCIGKTITKSADAGGCITLGPFIARTLIDIEGWEDSPGTSARNIGPTAPVTCASIYAGGNLMGVAPVFINRFNVDQDLDIDGVDKSLHLDAVGQQALGFVLQTPYRTFYDYDGDHDVDGVDGSLMIDAIGVPAFPYTGTYCP